MSIQTFFTALAPIWGFIVRAWSGVGPLVGVLIGSWLTRSWQASQWVLDAKKAEYRELIGTLSESYHTMAANWPHPIGNMSGLVTGDQQREFDRARMAGYRVISDRIFIDGRLRAENVQLHWSELLAQRDVNKHAECWIKLHDDLVKIARKDLGISS